MAFLTYDGKLATYGGQLLYFDQGPVQLTIAYVATQFVFKWKAPAGSFLTFHNGNGTTSTVEGGDAASKTHTTDYSGAGTFNFWITGDVTDLTYVFVANQAFASGDISRYGELINLDTLFLIGGNYYGNINSLSKLLVLKLLVLASNQGIYGDLSKLYTASSLTLLNLINTRVTFENIVTFTGTISIRLEDCNWSSTDVDNAIASFKTLTLSKVILGGIESDGNAFRSVASDANLQILLTNGNSIQVNEENHIGTLGTQINTGPNAISDPNGSEADAITGWIHTGLGSPNVFESQGLIVKEGSYAFHTDANAVPTTNARINASFVVGSGLIFRFLYWVRHIEIGNDWRVKIEGVTINVISKNIIEYKKVIYYLTSTDVSLDVEIVEATADNDGGIYLDDLDIREVTFP